MFTTPELTASVSSIIIKRIGGTHTCKEKCSLTCLENFGHQRLSHNGLHREELK